MQTQPISVEIETSIGKPGFTIIGLASRSIQEAKQRITSALHHCQVPVKSYRTVINLAPAHLKKNSTGFDFAIAVAFLKRYQLDQTDSSQTLFLGELRLDGQLVPVPNIIPSLFTAAEQGFRQAVVPAEAKLPIALASTIEIKQCPHLGQYISSVRTNKQLPSFTNWLPRKCLEYQPGSSRWNQIKNQPLAKRAAIVAAAGGHHLLLSGPPGIGKSMMAAAVAELLPDLTDQQQLEVAALYSLVTNKQASGSRPPVRAPHQSVTARKLVGGTNCQPGETALAHHGVLLLDELPLFSQDSINSLRGPLENGCVTTNVQHQIVSYPANFVLVATSNPCPCGFFGSNQNCSCQPAQISRHQHKISEPIKDRIALHVQLQKPDLLSQNSAGEVSFQTARTMVARARAGQLERNGDNTLNGQLSSKQTEQLLMKPAAELLLKQATKKLSLSHRSLNLILQVARTIADLSSNPPSAISADHLAESLQYRAPPAAGP